MAKKEKIENADSSWNFPKQTLEESLKIPRAIDEKHGGNPIDAEDLAKMVGFNKSQDWRFRELLRSANQYGIVEGAGAKATVELTDIGLDIIAPDSPPQRQNALLKAFKHVDLFNQVSEFYKGNKIPDDEYFSNTLIKQFSIPRDKVSHFIKVFQSNITYLKAFAAEENITETTPPTGDGSSSSGKLERKKSSEIREFLDTCFVLMPFGEWFDLYYEELYIPAIKEAGFEPMRADSLYNTGSVMEQIWEEIQKSKVLLADLSDKNPNVFYELGLSHAISKPVVLITKDLEDVPFDLRHLRVIVYDSRIPDWGEKLKKDITTYLKNTNSDPEKSIPQPFRHIFDQSEDEK